MAKKSLTNYSSLTNQEIHQFLFSKNIPTTFLDPLVSIPMLETERNEQLIAQKNNYLEKKTEINSQIRDINRQYHKDVCNLKKSFNNKKITQAIYQKQLNELANHKNDEVTAKKQTLKDFHQNKANINATIGEKIANLKQLYSTIKEYAKQYKSKHPDVPNLKVLENNFTYLKEAILYRGSRNYKYFTSDLQEYQQMSKKPVLFVRNLTKYYSRKKTPNINNLNFDVFPGEFHAFIGANGAGKTTTIKSLITSYYNWSGTILINGIKNLEESAKRKIGYIPEKAVFPDGFNTYDYLKWMVMLSGLKKEEACKVTENQLKNIGMWNMRHRSPNTFSSGQKKKVLLSQTLIHDPDIIIMDEPVANLDPKARIDFFDNLMELRKKNKAIFISSHVLAELDMYADALTILDGGKIVYSGPKETLLKRYDTNKYFLSINKKHQKAIEQYFKLNKTEFQSNKNGQLIEYELEFKKDADSDQFIQFMAKKKIVFDSFNRIRPSLEDIYKKMIVYGSMDTMHENMQNNRSEGHTKVTHFGKTY